MYKKDFFEELSKKIYSVAIEDTIELFVNKIHIASILATPENLKELGYGYLISEGVVNNRDEIKGVSITNKSIYLEIDSTQDFQLWHELRSAGCVGVKWDENEEIFVTSNMVFEPKIIKKSMKYLESEEYLKTHGTHAACLISSDGKCVIKAIDIGRHNTFDKVIGSAYIRGIDISKHFLISTGRQSAGMVLKAARAGIPLVATKTAPLSTGIKAAKRCNICLVCFVSDNNFSVFSHIERLKHNSQHIIYNQDDRMIMKNNKTIQGLIPAAGSGTRLGPFTNAIPKELLPVGDKAVIEHVVEAFKIAGIKDIIIVVSPKKHGLSDYFGSGKRFGVNITYVVQDERLGLANAIESGKHLINGSFAVVLGDNYFYPKEFLKTLIDMHIKSNADATLGVCEVTDVTRHGIIKLDKEKIIDVIEKPTKQEAPSNLGIMGAYVFEPVLFDAISKTKPGYKGEFQLTDSIKIMIDKGYKVIYKLINGGHIDVGTPEDLMKANQQYLNKRLI